MKQHKPIALLLVLVGLLLLGRPTPARAQACPVETEPNNDQASAQTFAGCVTGALADKDQDLYSFVVTPEQAGRPALIAFDGVPAALTKVDLVQIRDGRPRTLYTLTSPDGGTVQTPPLLLSAGDYLLGVYGFGIGPYTLRLTAGEPLPAGGDKEPNDRQEQATKVAGAFSLSGAVGQDADWYALSVGAQDAGQVWTVAGQAAVDRRITLNLYDSQGNLLARRGRDDAARAVFEALKLDAGVYFLQLQGDGDPPGVYTLGAVASPAVAAGGETEPNDRKEQANAWDTAAPVSGRLYGTDDVDTYRFTVPPAGAADRFDLILRSDSRQQRRVCLSPADGATLHCRDGRGIVTLADLSLDPGDYIVQIQGDADPAERYTLTRQLTGVRVAGQEDEPNDDYRTASSLDGQNRAAGRFAGPDRDIYKLVVTGKPQLWRIQVIGDGINSAALLNAVGTSEHYVSAQSRRRLRLTDVLLLPGVHYISVEGQDGAYRVIALPLGPPPEGVEQEPNDAPDQANPLAFAAPRRGLLNEVGDVDSYRFTLAAADHVRLTLTPPDDALLSQEIDWAGDFSIYQHRDRALGGGRWVTDLSLQPGDYIVRLKALEPGDSPYTILLQRGNPFAVIGDNEPNDAPELASPLPATLLVTGTVGSGDDYDWYRLPVLAADSDISLSAGPAITANVYDAKGNAVDGQFRRDPATGAVSGPLSASGAQPYLLRLTGDGPYTLKVAFSNGPTPARLAPAPPLKVSFSIASDPVAAFWPVGQAISGVLTLENTGSQPLTVALDSHVSDGKIRVSLAQTPADTPPGVSLRGGERAQLPVAVLIAADLPAGRFAVDWRARIADGAQATATATLTADPDAAARSPQRVWPVPDSLLGGMDLALLGLGAQIVTPEVDLAADQRVLHDGYTTLGDKFQIAASRLPVSLTVKLAGDGTLPVAGILLNPQGPSAAYEKLQDFELWLSADGQKYSKALSGSLSPALVEQAFALPAPVPAAYAQLRLLSNHAGNRGYVSLGEWKVVAIPGAAVSGPVNLADPAWGGEIVNFKPQQGDPAIIASMLRQDARSARIYPAAGSRVEWVLGFQHGRAAQIDSLEWLDDPATAAAERFGEVEVSVSTESPVGPWTPLGRWKLDGAPFSLPASTWARYLKFSAPAPAQAAPRVLPDAIRVFERPAGPDYRSIVGEWGNYNRDAVFEWMNPPADIVPAAGLPANGSADKAQPVTAGAPVQGAVQIGVSQAWYRIDVPADQDAVVLRLSGQPTVNVRAVFQDAAGKGLPVTVAPISPSEQVITATVPGGGPAFFRIEEPPRSVIFAWDQSGSLAAYQDTIYNAVLNYVAGVTPGREVVNLLPFGGKFLLPVWGEDPTVLQQALTDYDRADASSNVEESLLKATQELAFRDGAKAVVLITDAESEGYPLTEKLWAALEAVRPRVFTLNVMSNVTLGDAPASPQDIMQNYAAVNGGYYDTLRTKGDLDVVFARAAAWLRRPAGYSFTAATAKLPPPGPGRLQVLSSLTGDDAAASAALLGNTAVEIIFDASGSMREKLGASTRIGVARDTLNGLIDNVLPKGIPLALRAFGNREGNYSCRTDLEAPLAPLDPAALKQQVDAIQPQPLGGTPIAASLLKVAEDLKDAGPGPKLVILLTDGEESCKGDPAAAIRSLQQQGYDVRLNIVGFTVSDKKLKDQMASWAQAAGGQFFAADDPQSLSAALARAVRVPYHILDGEGQVVAQGLVDGDAVQVPAGLYRIEVQTDPVRVIEGVTVSTGQQAVVRVK